MASPLMWVVAVGRNNVVFLTDETFYLASVKQADVAAIDLALENGEPAEPFLPANAWKIPLADIERVEYKHSRVVVHQMMYRDLTIHYRDAKKSRRLNIMVPSDQMRDEIVNNLNERLGSWPIHKTYEPAWRILIRYLWIMLVIVALTIFFSGLLISGVVTEAPAIIAWYLNLWAWLLHSACGVMCPGMIACVVVLVTGVRQLRTPPVIVTYQPDDV